MPTPFHTTLDDLVQQGLTGTVPTRAQAITVLTSDDDVLLDVVAAASVLRRAQFANRVKLNFLVNLRSGLCPEDCSYCSQRRGSQSDIVKYPFAGDDDVDDAVERALSGGAIRICLVESGRGPSDRDIDRIASVVQRIHERHGAVEVCVSLGLLRDGQADRLREAGVFAYNHNLNTSAAHYGEICTTHAFADRVETVRRASQGGLSPCSGVLFGMGENNDDVVDVALALRELDPQSVPVNFLMPFDGTPLAGHVDLTPQRCLRILSLIRFIFPNVEVRLAGGREIHLRTLQPLALHIVNSIFLGDYLTSEGQAGSEDLAMIFDSGFVIEGHEEESAPATGQGLSLRRRGPGTALPANA
jgi:biotin synthase